MGIIHHDLGLKFLKCPKRRRAQELTAVIVSFPYINVSQGSVATQLRCGGIFNYRVIANFPRNIPVKEFWKSVSIQGRLSLSTDGDKCAMVNFGGNEKSILGGMKKFNIKSVNFVHKFNN